jgi:hypothetical protein
MNQIEIGRLLRAGTSGFVAGCRVSQVQAPYLGVLVRAPLEDGSQIYGMVSDIHIDDDGVVRQLVTAETVSQSVIEDNRLNRNVPLEISVLSVGYAENGRIFHLLPPRPPLSLDAIYLCSPQEICAFTSAGRFGYFRHILRAVDLPISELLASHLRQADQCQRACGNPGWASAAARELITLLRDDYATLMTLLSAMADALPENYQELPHG